MVRRGLSLFGGPRSKDGRGTAGGLGRGSEVGVQPDHRPGSEAEPSGAGVV